MSHGVEWLSLTLWAPWWAPWWACRSIQHATVTEGQITKLLMQGQDNLDLDKADETA